VSRLRAIIEQFAVIALLWLVMLSLVVHAQGDFALQPGDCQRIINANQLNLPGVDGLTIRFPPSCNEKYVADSVARAHKAGKPYTLLLMSNDSSQPATENNVRRVENIIYTLGRRYSTDPLCWGVHGTITPYQGASEELHWKRPMPAAAIEANKRIVFAWSRAFPNQVKLLAIAGGDRGAMEKLIDYAIATSPGKALIKNNALKASTSIGATHNQLLVYAANRGAMIGCEMVGSTREKRFGGTWQQAMAKRAEIERLAGRKFSYLAVYPQDLGGLK
jgi:hypothetical protein